MDIETKAAEYMDYRFAVGVIRHSIQMAKERGITLTPEQFGYDEFGDPGIDNMDPYEWVKTVAGEM